MRRFEKTIGVNILPWHDLLPIDQQLVTQAVFARQHAQCPYSEYAVGAALVTTDGDISTGQNVENVNWTATTHAEQAALVSAITANGPGLEVWRIAVVAAPRKIRINGPTDVWGEGPKSIDEVFGPCGHCRQILLENAPKNQEMVILDLQPDWSVSMATLSDFFPMAFGPQSL